MAAQLPVCQCMTLLQVYDRPPTANLSVGGRGSSTPAAKTVPVNMPYPRQLPRHILEDPQMCHSITAAACNYLADSATPPGNLPQLHAATQRFLNRSVGDEARNSDMFATAAGYICSFVQVADGLGSNAVEAVPCDNEGGSPFNRKLKHLGVDRVIIEMESDAAFEEHAANIQQLARQPRQRDRDCIPGNCI